MKWIFFALVLISVIFVSGCTEEEWNKMLCHGKSDSFLVDWAFKLYCKAKGVHEDVSLASEMWQGIQQDYIPNDPRCPNGAYYDKRNNNCISCGKNAELNLNTGQCRCLASSIPDKAGGCRERTEQEQKEEAVTAYPPQRGNQCIFSSDCKGQPSFGTCASPLAKVRYDCLDGFCVRKDFACPRGCHGGECQ